MRRIPFLDVRETGFDRVVHAYPGLAKELLKASRRVLGSVSDTAFRLLLPSGDRLSYQWLLRTNNPYLAEIRHVAETLHVPGVYAFNLCFEWGCTSGVFAPDGDPRLVRVLDWPFPRLGEHLIVVRQAGVAGEFYNVTWPGVIGVFQGMAPGRFAASLNQAPMQRHRMTYAGDWFRNRQAVFRSTGLPPAHLLRKAFEEAADFDQAKEMLARTPVAVPVIYTLAGVGRDEGCVIERTERDHAIRPIVQDRVCAANHFESHLYRIGRGWRPRPIDSHGRVRMARALPISSVDDRFAWFQPPIANAHTRLVLWAHPGSGHLRAFGTEGARRVTEVFDLTDTLAVNPANAIPLPS